MSRSRNIKPGFFRNEVLVTLPYEFRLLFIGLWTMADRAGRMEYRPMKIKMELFPADSIDVPKGLDALHEAGFIKLYVIDSSTFIQIVEFAKHQNPHMKEPQSTIPAPCEHGACTVRAETSTVQAPLIPDSLNLIPDTPKKATVRQVAPCDRFDDFWRVYPNKQGKQEAAKRWQRDKLDGLADQIIDHVILMAGNDDGWLRGFVPMGSTYLNQARWTDVPRAAPQQASQQPGKQMQGLMALEGMKNGLVPSRNHHGYSEIGSAGTGSPAIGRGFAGDGFGLDGGAGQRRALGPGRGHAEDSRGVLDIGPDGYVVAESAADD